MFRLRSSALLTCLAASLLAYCPARAGEVAVVVDFTVTGQASSYAELHLRSTTATDTDTLNVPPTSVNYSEWCVSRAEIYDYYTGTLPFQQSGTLLGFLSEDVAETDASLTAYLWAHTSGMSYNSGATGSGTAAGSLSVVGTLTIGTSALAPDGSWLLLDYDLADTETAYPPADTWAVTISSSDARNPFSASFNNTMDPADLADTQAVLAGQVLDFAVDMSTGFPLAGAAYERTTLEMNFVTAVPEPASALLLLMGGSTLAVAVFAESRRRRLRRS